MFKIIRQSYLLKHFGFSCTCRLCSLEGAKREQVSWTDSNILRRIVSILVRVKIEGIFVKFSVMKINIKLDSFITILVKIRTTR